MPAARAFPALSFADSDQLQVGDLVLAIGNPFGVGQTVTSGIVSALARTGVETGNFDYFIQTDAAINPGNSGGALVNLQGQLVGINTAIFTRSGGSVGIGFAIPANMAKTVSEAGEKGGPIVRPWFGARLQEVTTDIADSLNIDPPHGALITEVAPDSPAAKAGLKSGDAIIKIDGIDVDAPQGFDFRFATKEIGKEADITYERGGKTGDVEVAVAAASGAAEQTATIGGNTRFAGTTVSALTPPLAQDLNLPFDSKGIVVTDVAQGSPADEMGLRKGDIVLSIDGRQIEDVGTFQVDGLDAGGRMADCAAAQRTDHPVLRQRIRKQGFHGRSVCGWAGRGGGQPAGRPAAPQIAGRGDRPDASAGAGRDAVANDRLGRLGSLILWGRRGPARRRSRDCWRTPWATGSSRSRRCSRALPTSRRCSRRRGSSG